MKLVYRALAEAIFLVHLALVLLIVFFGWYIPGLWPWYVAALSATLVSDLVFGYCVLSKWEFHLRKKVHPHTDYDFAWTTYYTYRLTNRRISNQFYKRMSVFYLVSALLISNYFHFFYA